MLSSALGRMRVAGFCEALSYLTLLFIAMPLKYLAGMPEVVLVVGWIHGVLFIAFAAVTFLAWGAGRITSRLVGVAAIASLVPFGPFFMSRELNIFAPHQDDAATNAAAGQPASQREPAETSCQR